MFDYMGLRNRNYIYSLCIILFVVYHKKDGVDIMALRIVGRKEDDNGANTHYKLSDGRIVTRQEGVDMQKRGELPDYNVIEVNGVEYLRDNPDTSKEDNIDSQPKF